MKFEEFLTKYVSEKSFIRLRDTYLRAFELCCDVDFNDPDWNGYGEKFLKTNHREFFQQIKKIPEAYQRTGLVGFRLFDFLKVNGVYNFKDKNEYLNSFKDNYVTEEQNIELEQISLANRVLFLWKNCYHGFSKPPKFPPNRGNKIKWFSFAHMIICKKGWNAGIVWNPEFVQFMKSKKINLDNILSWIKLQKIEYAWRYFCD